MVIQHNHRIAEPQQIRTLCDRRLVHIHDHQNTVAVHHLDGILAPNDHVLLIFLTIPEQIDHRRNGSRGIVQDNVGLSSQGLCHAVDSHRCTEAVCIRHTVSHHKHHILGRNDLPQGMSLDTCLHTSIFLHLLTLSAVVGDAVRGLHHSLISAPSQRQINGIAGELVVLRIAQPIQTDSHAQGHNVFIADIDCLNILQQLKSGLLELCKCFLAHYHQILILLQLSADTVQGQNVFIDTPVHQSKEERSSHLFHAGQRFLIVVQIDHANRKRLIIQFLQRNVQCGLIVEVHRYHIAVVVHGLDHLAVICHILQRDLPKLRRILISFIYQLVLRLLHLGFVRKPVSGNGGKQCGDGFPVPLGQMGDLLKSLIGPENLAAAVQQRIGQIQFPKQPLLYLSVLRRKTDQFVHNTGLIIKI